MLVTLEMMEAARWAEYGYYQRGRMPGTERFIPTPDTVIMAMLPAVLKLVEVEALTVEQPRKPAVVSAKTRKPRRQNASGAITPEPLEDSKSMRCLTGLWARQSAGNVSSGC